MDTYSEDVERKMKQLFAWLSEKDRRRYAAVEALKLGHGGVEYIAQLFQCDPKTVRQGMHDLALKWYRRGLDMPGLDDEHAIGLRYDMAEVYRYKGDFDQALKMYTEVFGVDSTYREVAARLKEMKKQLSTSRR